MMQKEAAQALVSDTLQGSFNKERFVYLLKNILNHIDEDPFTYKGSLIFRDFADSIESVERIAKYKDPEQKLLDILIVRLHKETSLDRARTTQRNFVAKYLKGSRSGESKDAALVAFVPPGGDDWRFSLVKMEYRFNERGKVEEEFTPARRYSFLVGKNENTHTAQSRLLPLLLDDETAPTLEALENAFSVERVTREFFEKYRDLFLRLKESLDVVVKKDAKIKADFRAKEVDTVNFAKKLLGQIVFLYFLQKKGWFGVMRGEPWGSGSKRFLRELYEQKHGAYENFFNDILEPLFYEALRLERPKDYYDQFKCRIPFLNGGLFDPINEYDWQDTDIFIPNELFSNTHKTKEGDIGDGILDIFDRYNFTVKEDEPLEKDVAVDPEMLGKVFENLLEIKDRKSRGTYYTPREIVHYMCRESLANHLESVLLGKVSKEDIGTLIEYGESVVEHDSRVVNEGRETKTYAFKLPQSIRKNAPLIDKELASTRVCDPAVGSGAFPVGMMSEIVRTRNALTPYLRENGKRSPYQFKRHAIQHCLYGVDIDPGAVEIAKLRLWLSLIVDEEERETIQPLPNLDYKIVQGNSLLRVQMNLFNQQLLKQLEELKPLYFNETSSSKKQKYKKQIDDLISQITNGHKDFDFDVYFSEVFHEKKGFDVVIANPPYVSHVNFSKTEKVALRDNYHTFKGRADIYIAFYEQGLNILKNGAHLVFIAPNKFFRAGYGKDLRGYIKDNTKVISIVDFGDSPIFEATTYPSILLLQKTTVPEYKFNFLRAKNSKELIDLAHFAKLDNSYLSGELWTFENEELLHIWEKIRVASVSLREYIDNKFYRGIVTGLNEAFIISEEQKNVLIGKNRRVSQIIKPYLKGKNVKRWVSRSDSYIIFTYHGVDISQYPEILEHLKPFRPKLEKRATSKNHRWYELQQPQTGIYRYYEETKIISTDIAKRCEFTIDTSGAYIDATIFCIPVNDLYLLALLNSLLIETYFKNQSSTIRGDFLRFKKIYLDSLPIRNATDDEKARIVKLVENVLALTKSKDNLENRTRQAKVREYEKQIDQLVYQLYGLTPAEIKVIENSQ
jgi:hypothetical protein